ncbi:MAG: Inosose dehydratase [Pedosphaera sp.]|nr:Inosose dehydratase [Pedosphaera sp.]
MKIPALSKREFLKLGGAGMLACLAARPAQLLAAEKKKIPVGLQLYSVRKECAKDLDGTLAEVAKIGYQGVEFAGYYGREAKQLRKLLADTGLKCCGTHISLETLQGDALARTIEFNQTIGNPFLIVPGLPDKYTKSRQGWLDAAEIFNGLADELKPHGMRVGYHNHNIEFKPLDGELPEDTFFGHTKKEVVMQFDTGNGMEGGGDAMIFLAKYPGRAASIHAKAYSKKEPTAVMGDDELPWKDIFNLCETTAGTEWYIIEYEFEPAMPNVKKSFEVMHAWGKC